MSSGRGWWGQEVDTLVGGRPAILFPVQWTGEDVVFSSLVIVQLCSLCEKKSVALIQLIT